MAQIAKEFFCSKSTIRDALIRAGIPLRKRQQKGRSSVPRCRMKITNGGQVTDAAEQKIIQVVTEMKRDGISYHRIAALPL